MKIIGFAITIGVIGIFCATVTAQRQQIRGYSEQMKPIPDHWSEVTEPSHENQGE